MSIILRCPKCEKHYESPDEALKKSELQCPECGLKSHSGDFCVMMFCPHCLPHFSAGHSGNRMIADMELPRVIANIPQIRTFRRRR